jgi:uncharacterized protein
MTEPTLLDHALVAVLMLVLPVWTGVTYRRFLAKVRDGGATVRLAEYRWTTIAQWALVAATLAIWLHADRDLSTLGFSIPQGTRAWLVAGLCLAICGFFVNQLHELRAPDANLSELGPQLEPVKDLMPQSEREVRWFVAVSCTAGICEEILFRGYLIAYLTTVLPGSSPWLAVVIGGASFGFAHFYQGPSGIVKTGIVGLLMGAFYVLGGSLLPLMILHAVVDITGGLIGYHYFRVVTAKQ